MNLRIPGPTPLPPTVREASSRQMINHRGPQFASLIKELTSDLQQFFLTKNDLYLLTGSGTGAMEAAVVNFLSPGDPVLAVSIGVFGDRFARMLEAFGARVVRLSFPRGQAADPEAVASTLRQHPEVVAVYVTHNETSTGVTNPLPEIARVVRDADKLLVVDAISSVGSIEFRTDEWGVDVAVSGSQKSWMSPPGVAMITVSPRAWEYYQRARMPRFYWDIGHARSYLEKGQTPWTPAVGVFFALQEALRLMKEEGLERIIERHRRVGEYTRRRVRDLGLELFADERYASDTVTAVRVPPGVDGKLLVARMRERHGVVLSGGQADLAGQIFRIGHLGWVDVADIEPVFEALRQELGTTARA